MRDVNFGSVPEGARLLWAKSGEPKGHSLLAHALDVAAVAEALLTREPDTTLQWAAAMLGLPGSDALRWLAWVCALHDLGKAVPAFQARWDKGRQRLEACGLRFSAAALGNLRHDHVGAATSRDLLVQKFGEAPWILPVCMAIGAHHGYMPSSWEIERSGPLASEHSLWFEARSDLFRILVDVLHPGSNPATQEFPLPAAAWLAGLISVADWIASDPDWFPFGERGETLREHHSKALELAGLALELIGWPRFGELLRNDEETSALIARFVRGKQVQARELQRVGHAMLRQATGPILMLVEAPMGEGKTELAFLAHLELQRRNHHRGFYVALPTQAAGNSLFSRVLAFLRAFAGEQMRLDMQLVHSQAVADLPLPALREVDHSADEAVSCSAWFARHKRPLLSPYGVGTVDQALLAVLHVRHHFVRLWGLANRVVVLDEVHAYDTYTTTLIESLLQWLKELNCSVILMSATLPGARRAALLKAWGVREDISTPYPRVALATGNRIEARTIGARHISKVLTRGIGEGLEAVEDVARQRWSEGGCGAVILDTVDRAQSLYKSLKQSLPGGGELWLFHARMPAEERSRREEQILERFGKDAGSRRPERALVIATQVLEQSVDVDFDYMISDLAPVDLLLQRAGRLHRHPQPRPPAHKQPVLFIAGLLPDRPPDLVATGWGFVYEPYILLRTWLVLKEEKTWNLPRDIDRLVQTVYSNGVRAVDLPEWLSEKLDKSLEDYRRQIEKQCVLAQNAVIEVCSSLDDAYVSTRRVVEDPSDEGTLVSTRWGDEGVTVVPVHVENGTWRLDPEGSAFDPARRPADELAVRLYRRQVRLSRSEIVKSILSEQVPPAFRQHPLLRHLRPLKLTGGRAQFGSVRVELDDELGIVYKKVERS